jgi:acetolactate synthase regulatory subunit
MEQTADRDSEQYANQLQQILDAKSVSIQELRNKLKQFQKYRNSD